jgi:uncharacterized repeat protein (TIGR01451 family)
MLQTSRRNFLKNDSPPDLYHRRLCPMKKMGSLWLLLAAVSLWLPQLQAQAEQHRATHLGAVSTRFAPPLHTPDDLRARFRDPLLQPDILSILKQWGWPGNPDDLFQAAQTADLSDITIPVGTVLPFMSSRDNGDPVCLRNVTWAGKSPIPAYAFEFSSNGRNYRCVTPKPCSNFLVEDLGPVPKPELALDCSVPARWPATRAMKVYLNVSNPGDAVEPLTTVNLFLPPGVTATNASDGGVPGASTVLWEIPNLAPHASQKIRATVVASAAGPLAFHSTASGTAGESAQTDCETEAFNVHGILVEVVDLVDPVEVGGNVIYIIRITNQGTAPDTNLRLTCTVPDSQQFVSSAGTTAVSAAGLTLTMDPIPSLEGKAVAAWRVVTKALTPDDSRFKVQVSGDQFEQPIHREESTHLY